MAAPPIAVERFRVEHGTGFTMSVISLIDRRAAGNVLSALSFSAIWRRCCMVALRVPVGQSGSS